MVNAVNIASSLDTPRQIDRFRLRMQSAGVWMKQRSPFLILMHGPSGSGKSWTSEPLIPALQAVRIRSDLERKRLANVPLQAHRDDHINQGIYHPSFTSQTYAHLLKCAEQCLQGGVNTIVDAAFLHETQRHAFAMLAAHMNIRYFILSCSAEPRVLRQRVVARRQTATDPSDAGIDVLEKQLQALQPFTADEESHVIRVRSDDDRDASSLAAIIRQRLMRDGALTEA
jgi:predicted kinase